MSPLVNQFYEFGQFRIDVAERLLLRHGTPLSLAPKAFDILLTLVQQRGHVLEKRELLETVWPNTFIEENNLTQYISALRKALGDDRHEQQYIETVARRGYRFIAPVTEVHSEGYDLIVENRTRVRIVVKEEREEREQEFVVRARDASVSHSAHKLQQREFARYALAALLLAVIMFSVYWLASRVRQPPGNADASNVHTIVVLPLKPAGAGDADQYIGLALAHDLSSRLDRDGLHPLSVSASYRYLDYQGDPVGAGRELGVDAVIYGRFTRSGRRIGIDAQIVRVRDGVSLWTKSFEDDSRNAFALQNTIASAVGHVFSKVMTRDSAPAPPPGTLNLDAYEASEKGCLFLSKRTSEGIHLSVGYFEQAITEDPNYALAYAGLAEAYAFDIEKWKLAESTAQRALAIDKNLGEAYAIIGFVHMFWRWDWEFAERELRRAIELNPEYATAHQWYAVCLAAEGRLLDAKEEMRKALGLDPFSSSINADMGQMFYFSQQYDEAIEQCQKTIAMDPDFLNSHIYLYEAYQQRRMYDKAFAEYFLIQKLDNGNLLYSPAAEGALRKAYEKSGIKGFWKARLAFLEKRSHDNIELAESCARLGDQKRTLVLLNKAYQERNPWLAFLNVNPVFSDLRTDPRFERLSDRIFPKNEKQRSS